MIVAAIISHKIMKSYQQITISIYVTHYIKQENEVKNMSELIKVDFDTETVSARELHDALGVASRFSRWFDSNKDLFVEGDDYNKCTSSTLVNNGASRELDDYQISILMAKHLAMMSRTEKGKIIRNYLIDLEKAWNTPEQVMARALKLAGKTISGLKLQIEQQKPLVEFAHKVSATTNVIDMGKMAKLLKDEHINIGRNRLFQWLRQKEILMSNNIPYQRYINAGCFEVKESTYETPFGSKTQQTTYVTGKGQIYITEKIRRDFSENIA